MRAGDLRNRVTIQAPGQGADSLGQPLLSWSDVATVWSSITFQRGAATKSADAIVSVATATIRIRYRPDITASMRVVYGTSVFKIIAVLPDEESRQYVDLLCELPS